MFVVAIAWIYVVLMMAVAEATNSNGSVLGALVTFVFYGVLPLGIVMYVLRSPARRRALRAAEAEADSATARPVDPDGGGHAAGDPIAPEREKP